MRFLHAGCGTADLPPYFDGLKLDVVRLDIDPGMKPDIVASIADLGDIGHFDIVYASHCLEHLYPQYVKKALSEFYRVADTAIVVVPDLTDVKATEDFLYESPGGPICGLDMIYGCRTDIELTPYMAHHSGFVVETLEAAMSDAGFVQVTMIRLFPYNLMAVGQKRKHAQEKTPEVVEAKAA